MTDIRSATAALVDGTDLDRDTMQAVMRQIMTGEATPAQIAGFLVALRIKGETVDEIAGAAAVMRELASPVPVDAAYRDTLVDVVGTGGDASGVFNVSTASAFVVAAAGGRVAKHGNRAVSGKSGAADVLEAAGVRLALSPEAAARCVAELGVAFLFAPAFHGAMKHAIGPRRELGLRTVFNLLGPLTNPAGAPNQLLGVYDRRWLEPMAAVLRELGSRHVLVVCSEDGLDEISHAAPTHFAELRDGEVLTGVLNPAELGVEPGSLDDVKAIDATVSLACLREALGTGRGARADLVALNAGAALYVAGLANTISAGVEQARGVMRDASALARLEAYAARSRELAA